MHRANLLQQLQEYQKSTYFSQNELPTYERLVAFINQNENCFSRNNPGHITSSIWIVNKDKTGALLTHHKKLQHWFQLGGHNDEDPDCRRVALKEAREESGIKQFTFLSDSIFDIDIHPLPNKCTFHYDVRYLLQACDDQLTISDESLNLAWVPFDQLINYTQELSIVRMHEKFVRFHL